MAAKSGIEVLENVCNECYAFNIGFGYDCLGLYFSFQFFMIWVVVS